VSSLYINVKSPISPRTEGPPCLYNPPSPTPRMQMLRGLTMNEVSFMSTSRIPRFWGHQSFWISEEGMLEVRSSLPWSSCLSLASMEYRPTDRSIELDYAVPAPLAGRKIAEQQDQRGNLLLTNYQLVTFTHRHILPRYLKMGDTYLAQYSCIVLKLNTQITQCSICTVNLYCIADILL